MIPVPAGVRVWLATGHTDMRRGFPGLISIRPAMLPDVVKPDLDIRRLPTKPEGGMKPLSVPARLKRTGLETKLLMQGT